MGGRKAVREGFLEEVVCELPLEEGTYRKGGMEICIYIWSIWNGLGGG